MEKRSRRWEIIDEEAPITGEPVMRKDSPSAFWGTPLVGHLTAHNVATIIAVGETTSGCVRASAVEASKAGPAIRYQLTVSGTRLKLAS